MCTLCYGSAMGYPEELVLKELALQEFWRDERLPGSLQAIVPSPRGRHYRTVSKRRVLAGPRGARLALMAPDDDGRITPREVDACAIEPVEHAAIYDAVRESLQRPSAGVLAEALQYVIVKGSYTEFTVILNVRSIDGPLVKAANALSKSLTKRVPAVGGFFLFEGERAGNYYMGTRDVHRQPRFRRLYGREMVYQQVAGRRFLFSPLSFSQVNLLIIEQLVQGVGAVLMPARVRTFFDLYCGYGVFAICLAPGAGRVLGVELSATSVQAARENAQRNRVENAQFLRNEIDRDSLERLLQQAGKDDVALLDPPRNGVAPGVIEVVASRRMGRIVHLFCNIDLLGRDLAVWQESGYRVGRVVPFDMFPGTAAVELMVELTAEEVRAQ